ncbi:MAG: nucleotidyltransferase [Dehalococcoidia bacterium]|nr:nucleotidyltransferase [Dehalococcoidia bacterium]
MRATAVPYLREAQLLGFLERICQALELTPTQFGDAEDHYRAVATFLAAADDPLLRGCDIYPQGSAALGTTVRPEGRDEHDIDLVARFPVSAKMVGPATVRNAVGRRLAEHATYRQMLEPKNRCWRLRYAGQFHLDITPSVPNPTCASGGELVPDREARMWKPTNPLGFCDWFSARATLVPSILAHKELSEGTRAQIEPLPAQTPLKGILRRTVQLLKRHRDLAFRGEDADLKPISIIITTLAARSYEACAATGVYATELDVVLDVVERLPHFFDAPPLGKSGYFVLNPTTSGENFAEKWNANPDLASAFVSWHKMASSDLRTLLEIAGQDTIERHIGRAFGEQEARAAIEPTTKAVEEARTQGKLSIAATGVMAGRVSGSVRPRPNTNFGR